MDGKEHVLTECPEPQEMDLLVEGHIARRRAEIERAKEALIFGKPSSESIDWPASDYEVPVALAIADAVLALVNSQPRTPMAHELAAVIGPLLPPAMPSRADFGPLYQDKAETCCGDFERCGKACYHRGYKAKEREIIAHLGMIQGMQEAIRFEETDIRDSDGWKSA